VRGDWRWETGDRRKETEEGRIEKGPKNGNRRLVKKKKEEG